MDLYYINLDHRTDRKQDFLAECKRIGYPESRIHRFPAIRDTKMPFLGCTRSHLGVLKLAQERELPCVFIAEDDLSFATSVKSHLEIWKIACSGPFDVIMIASYTLSSAPLESAKDKRPLRRVLEAQAGSGYIVHSRFYGQLIECFEEGVKKLEETGIAHLWMNDQIWKRLQRKPEVLWYVCEPKLGYQRASYSDLALCNVNYGV